MLLWFSCKYTCGMQLGWGWTPTAHALYKALHLACKLLRPPSVEKTDKKKIMAAAVAGEILGPRPGKAICSFWQGGMEMALRVIAPVVSSVHPGCLVPTSSVSTRVQTLGSYQSLVIITHDMYVNWRTSVTVVLRVRIESLSHALHDCR